MFNVEISTGSYAWQSILKARSIIANGMIWRIDDGKSLRIFGDNWLPAEFLSRVISPQNNLLTEKTVSFLFDLNIGG